MEERHKSESFVRWQGRTVEEFGKTINLILAISLATIGFVINKLLEAEFKFENCWSKTFIAIGTLTLIVTSATLLTLFKRRLFNFRNTTAIARKREKNQIDNLKMLREKVRKAGDSIWCIFTLSIWLFGVGEGLIIIGFIFQTSSKL